MHFMIREIVAKSVFENIDELHKELKAEPEYKQYFWLLHYFTSIITVTLPFRRKNQAVIQLGFFH